VATPRGVHRRHSLLARFWPELDQEHARTALRQALRVLRVALGAEVLTSRGDDEVGLDFGHVSIDVTAFDAACGAGVTGALDALNLYRGPLLNGFCVSDAPEFERWLDSERGGVARSEEHTSELQSRGHLVCRLLLEKKKENCVFCAVAARPLAGSAPAR